MNVLVRRWQALVARPEGGFSLVELLIYAVLSVLVLTVVAGIVMNGVRVQKSVQSITTATATATTITRSLQQGIANADGVGNAAGFSVSSGGQLLQARTATVASDGTPTWRCAAWYYSPTTSILYTKSSTSGTVAGPAGTPDSSWTVLGTGIGVPSGSQAFTATSSTVVAVSLTVASTGTRPVVITTSQQSTQSDSAGAPTTCF